MNSLYADHGGAPGGDGRHLSPPEPAIGSAVHMAPVALAAGGLQSIPDRRRILHLQFRRFTGCPTCNLQVHAFRRRQQELAAAQVRSLLVFPMVPREAVAGDGPDGGSALVADRDGALARHFGVAAGVGALLHPSAWPALLVGLVRHGFAMPRSFSQAFRYPVDVLIDCDGTLLDIQHAGHAGGAWGVDEVVRRAAAAGGRRFRSAAIADT